MGLKSTITRNVIVDWLGKGVGIVAGLVLTPVLISHLGKYEYGLWVSIGLSVFWLLHLDLGVSGSVTKYISENLALKDDQGNIEVFSSALAILFANSFLALLVVLGVLYFIPDIFSVEGAYVETSRWVFAIGGFSILFVFPLRVGRGLLQARLRYDLISLFELISVITNLTLIVLIFGRGYGNLLHLSALYAGLGMVTETAIFITALKLYPGLLFRASAISKKAIRKLFSVGSSFFLGALSSMAITRGQTIITGIFLGLGMAPFIAIPNQVLSQLSQFVTVWVLVFSLYLEAWGRKEESQNCAI
jgi:O-antigen/teichoic acid export membrane protein